MDKKSSQPIRGGHVAKWRQKGELILQFGLKRAVGEEKVQNSKMEGF